MVRAAAAVIAFLALLGGQAVLAVGVGAASTVDVDGHTYSQDAVDALTYLNSVRARIGVPAMQLDPLLTKAASDHAAYLLANRTTGHSESAGSSGFSGEMPWDRAKSAGFDTAGNGVFEDVTYMTRTTAGAVQSLLDAPLHRSSLIVPRMTMLGVGFNTQAMVLNPAKIWYDNSGYGVYPYDGQKDVPVAFDGNENPNPLEQVGLKSSGYVITFSGVEQSKTDIAASLADSSGQAVDFVKLRQDLGDIAAWHLIPKQPLQYSETYTVTAEGKTWSFTTVASPEESTAAPAAPATAPAAVDKAPRRFSSADVGVRIDGKYVELTPKASVYDGSTFIPIRGVFEAMGATVSWSQKAQEVTISKGADPIVLTIGSKTAKVGGSWRTLSAAPFLSAEGSAYVPLRFASEALGAKVGWEADTYTAVIDTQ